MHGVIEEGYRADLIVEHNVELKSVEALLPVLAPFPRCRAVGRIHARQYDGSSGRQKRWPEVKIILRADSGFCRWKMLRWCESDQVNYIVGCKDRRSHRSPARFRALCARLSNMIAVQNQVEFEQAANQRLGSFTEQHRRVLGRDFVPRIAGLLICYNIPAVDLNGTGRTFVVSYQRITSFGSATPAERKFFGDFHSETLQNYRR